MYVTYWEGIRCAWRVQTSTEVEDKEPGNSLNIASNYAILTSCFFCFITFSSWIMAWDMTELPPKWAYYRDLSLFQGNPAYCFIIIVYHSLMLLQRFEKTSYLNFLGLPGASSKGSGAVDNTWALHDPMTRLFFRIDLWCEHARCDA